MTAITNKKLVLVLLALTLVSCTPDETATAQTLSGEGSDAEPGDVVTIRATGVLPEDGSFDERIYTVPSDVTELGFGILRGIRGVALTNVEGLEQLTEVETLVMRMVRPPVNERSMVVPDGVRAMRKLRAVELQTAVLRNPDWLPELPELSILSFTRDTRWWDPRQEIDFTNLRALQLLWLEDLSLIDNAPDSRVVFRVNPNTQYVFLGTVSVGRQGDVLRVDDALLQALASVDRVIIRRDLVEQGQSQGHTRADFDRYDNVVLVDTNEDAERLLPRDMRPSRVFGDWHEFPAVGE